MKGVDRMTTTTMNSTKTKKHDWSLVLCGVLVFIMGIIVLTWPGLSMVTLAIMAGIILIVAGIGSIVTYTKMKGIVDGAGWILANGICDIILGSMFLVWPITSAEMLPWIAGVFVMVYSIYAIIAGVAMKGTFPGWGLMLASGIIGILCGIMFIVSPASFVIFLGVYLICRGTMMAIDGIVSPSSLDYL